MFNIDSLSKNLSFYLRFLVIFISLINFNSFCFHIILENNNLECSEHNCNFELKLNQNLKYAEDKRIIKLFEKDKNGEEKLINLIFYTTDISNIVAYSGKPLEILISLNYKTGNIDNLKLIKHSEPILLTGIPIEKLLEALAFYKNKNINDRINIGEDLSGETCVPIIAGATVTSLILHETILSTARDVGKIFNIFNESDLVEGGLNTKFEKLKWKDLLKIKAIKHFRLDSSFCENNNIDKENLLIDIYFADIKHPSIGRNILGDFGYTELFSELNNNKSAIIILNNGIWSFKGSGFVRGGIFDRFRIEQDNNIFSFRDSDLKNVYDLECIDLDNFRETGIFIVSNAKYKPYKSWKLVLLFNYKTYTIEYSIPKSFCLAQKSMWIKTWESKIFYIFLYILLWISVVLIFIFRNDIVKNNFYLSIIYNFILVSDIYIIGFLFEGQPSIVNILAMIDDVKHLYIFLMDPCIFIGWILIIITTVFWGKAFFCGWICPFGALQEILFKIKNIIFKNEKSLEFKFLEKFKLKYLRYLIFFILIFVSFKNFEKAELLSEIEPFKTIWIIGISNRFKASIYTIFLLFISFFIYRFFCRFLCPLGAFLSILSYRTFFNLNRRATCTICKICKKTCNSNAINNFGNIDNKECFGCFTCISNMYNTSICPPLKKKFLKEKYEKNIKI